MNSNEVSLQICLCLVIDVLLVDVGLAVVRRTYVIVQLHITHSTYTQKAVLSCRQIIICVKILH